MTCAPGSGRNGGTGPNNERYRRAIEMRDAGAKLREIGVELGVSPERARQMVSPYRRPGYAERMNAG